MIFTKFGLGKGVPGPHFPAKFHRCGLKNVGAPKMAKNGNFWYKFAPKGKFWGPQKLLNIGAQQQIFLCAMTP